MTEISIAVVAPLKAEIAPLVRRLRAKRRHRLGAVRWCEGTLRGRRLAVATTGDGQRAAATLDALLDLVGVRQLIIVGVAGALSPSLLVGTLVVGDDVRSRAGPAPRPCPSLVSRAASLPGARAGTLISDRRIATTPGEKEALWHAHGAPGPAAVDLETADLAHVVARHGVSYVAIRAISDTAEETLPIDFNRWADATGHVRQGAVAWEAIKHPRLVPPLLNLRQRVNDGAERLAGLIEMLLEDDA